MNFPNKFKIWWWAGVVVLLTWISAWRLGLGTYNNFDIFVFTAWFILILFPLISEVSIGSISIKKEIEDVKKEIKEQIWEIKNEIRNHINVNPTINVHAVPVNQQEYQKKIEDEVNEEEKRIEEIDKSIPVHETEEHAKTPSTSLGAIAERFKREILVEGLVSDYLTSVYGERFKSQVKIASQQNNKSLIVDGILLDKGKISKIIENRLITAKSFDHMFYVLSNFVKKVVKIGVKIPIQFIIVSEGMNNESVQQIEEQVRRINWTRKINDTMPKISAIYFRVEDERLTEIRSKENE